MFYLPRDVVNVMKLYVCLPRQFGTYPRMRIVVVRDTWLNSLRIDVTLP